MRMTSFHVPSHVLDSASLKNFSVYAERFLSSKQSEETGFRIDLNRIYHRTYLPRAALSQDLLDAYNWHAVCNLETCKSRTLLPNVNGSTNTKCRQVRSALCSFIMPAEPVGRELSE
jgi:hypothetical protein